MRRDPYQSIADPNRRKIIEVLKKESPLTMNALADKFDISRPAVSKHVKILEKSGVVEIKQVRVERFCYLKADSLEIIKSWIEDILDTKDKPKKAEKKPKPPKEPVDKKPAKKQTTKAKKAVDTEDEEDQLSLF